MYCVINSFAQLSTTVTTACYIMVQNKVQKNISSFFGNPKRKVDSEKNAPPSKKQQCTDTLDVPSTNPSTSSTVSESTQAHTTELLVTSSKTFSDKILVSSHGLNDVSPTQVFLEKFPPKKYGEKYRSFSSAWYKGRPWLEYSTLWELRSVNGTNELKILVYWNHDERYFCVRMTDFRSF